MMDICTKDVGPTLVAQRIIHDHNDFLIHQRKHNLQQGSAHIVHSPLGSGEEPVVARVVISLMKDPGSLQDPADRVPAGAEDPAHQQDLEIPKARTRETAAELGEDGGKSRGDGRVH